MHLEKLLERLEKAKKYMDAPYNKKMQGEELQKAIKEREKYVPELRKLMKEITICMMQSKIH